MRQPESERGENSWARKQQHSHRQVSIQHRMSRYPQLSIPKTSLSVPPSLCVAGPRAAMVNFKVTATELHARSFLESLDVDHMSNRSSCKIRLTADMLHTKEFRGNESRVTVIWTKSTQKVQVMAGAAIVDKAASILEELWEKYDKWLNESVVVPPPAGSERLSTLFREKPYSTFMISLKVKADALVTRQRFIPPDPRYTQAMASITEGAASLLADFPEWNLKFQTAMVQDFGAPEEILHAMWAQEPFPEQEFAEDDGDFEITSSPDSKGSGGGRKWQQGHKNSSASKPASAGRPLSGQSPSRQPPSGSRQSPGNSA